MVGIILPCNQDIAKVKPFGKLFLLAVLNKLKNLRGAQKFFLALAAKKNYLIPKRFAKTQR
jgi:hypothetical protein